MMSAGDLDGDTYLAIWDPNIVKYFECYEPSNPEDVKKPS